MGEGDDDRTRPLRPITPSRDPILPVEQTPSYQAGFEAGKKVSVGGMRTFGWAHAFMVVGVVWAIVLFLIVLFAILFADKLPTAGS